uniref:Uncharacterized protein n=1 Tax=Arundo donax TaxID=35708 RepID=A0A0A9AIK2_ARUDO
MKCGVVANQSGPEDPNDGSADQSTYADEAGMTVGGVAISGFDG